MNRCLLGVKGIKLKRVYGEPGVGIHEKQGYRGKQGLFMKGTGCLTK